MEPALCFAPVLQYLHADSDWLLTEAYVCRIELQYMVSRGFLLGQPHFALSCVSSTRVSIKCLTTTYILQSPVIAIKTEENMHKSITR
jgi:hypothetical protein